MYVTTLEMLKAAKAGGYAVGAFNAENAEMVWAIIAAAEEAKAPVIVQTTSSTLRYFSPAWFGAMVRRAAQGAAVPVALHLDHGSSIELVQACIAEGYTSVMIDGSALPYEENLALAARAKAIAAEAGVPVEAELGVIGGKEDDTQADGSNYTDPAQAADFARRTGVDSLAISIGTAHGFYPRPPVLDLGRITATQKLVDIPLVLHGASGVPNETVTEAVRLGMCKVNFATELRAAYTEAVRETLAADEKLFDPKKYGEAARQAVKALAMKKMQICQSAGRA